MDSINNYEFSLSNLKLKLMYLLYHSYSSNFIDNTKNLKIHENSNLIKERKFDDENGEFRISNLNIDLGLDVDQIHSISLDSRMDKYAKYARNPIYRIDLKILINSQSLRHLNVKNLILCFEPKKELSLKYLSLINTKIKGVDLLKLIKTDQLKYLNLSKYGLEGKLTLKKLMNRNPSNLRYLNLTSNYLENEGMKYLDKWNLVKLRYLNLTHNYLGNDGLKHISKWECPELKMLSLSYNSLGSEGLKHLEFWVIPKLKYFYLIGNNFGAEGLNYLKEWKLTELKVLNLGSNSLINQSLTYLLKWDPQNLKYLYLNKNNQLNFTDLEVLKIWNLEKLEFLDFRDNFQNPKEYVGSWNDAKFVYTISIPISAKKHILK